MAAVSGFSTPAMPGGPPTPAYTAGACGSFVPPAPVGTGAGAAVGMPQYAPYHLPRGPSSYTPTPCIASHAGMVPTLPPDQAAQLMSARSGAAVAGGGQWVLPPTMPHCAAPAGATGTGPPKMTKNPLTEGIPDPASIETQKKNYEKSLDASLEQSKKMAAAQIKQQKEALKVAAEQQLAMYKAQMDQSIKQHELGLDQQLQQQHMEMQQALLQQKTLLEQQASALSMEYKQRKMQEEMMLKQAEMHAEMQTLQGRMQEEMAQHHQAHLQMQQQHLMQQHAQNQHIVSQQQAQELQLRDQMQREMLAQQQQLAPQGAHLGVAAYPGMPPGAMHPGGPSTFHGSVHHGASSMPTEYPIGVTHIGAPCASTAILPATMGLRPVEGPSVVPVRVAGSSTPAAPGPGATPVGTVQASAIYGGRPSMYGGQSVQGGAVYVQPVTSVGPMSIAGGGSMSGAAGAPFEPVGAQLNDGSVAGS